MDIKKSLYIFKKDWQEIYKNKEIILPVIILPLIFSVVLPIAILGLAIAIPEGQVDDIEALYLLFPMFSGQENPVLKTVIWFYVNSMMKPIFLLAPMVLTMVVAADSFAGEKERKTIETLLVLPITDKELIVGKVLTSLIPGLLGTWGAFGIFSLIVYFMTFDIMGFFIIGFDWFLLVFLFATLLSFFSVLLLIINSSRAKNVKSAQNVAVIVVLPIISLVFTQLTNVFVLNEINTLILSGFLGVLDIAMVYLGGRQLNRDRLISRIT